MNPIIEEVVRRHDGKEPIHRERGQRLKRCLRAVRAVAEAKKDAGERYTPREDISRATRSTLDVFRKVENVNLGELYDFTPIMVVGETQPSEGNERSLIGVTVGVVLKNSVKSRTSAQQKREAFKQPDGFSVRDVREAKIFVYRMPYDEQESIGLPRSKTAGPGDAEELCSIVVDLRKGTTNVGNIGLFIDLMEIVNGAVVDMNADQPVLASS